MAETVEGFLSGFDEREQEIAAMRLQGHSELEISAAIGRSERTVRRVLKRLKQRVERLRDEAHS